MKRLRLFAPILVIGLAISALASASASASPEWFKGGVKLAANVPVKATSGVGLLKGGGTEVKCKTDESKAGAAIEAPNKMVKAIVVYKECEKNTKKCTSTGKAAGEIEMKE